MRKTKFIITFEDGETHTQTLWPIMSKKYLAMASPSGIPQGFGIDWCTLDKDHKTIATFQDTKISDISHTLDAATGQFVPGGASTTIQDLLRQCYHTETYHEQQVPCTWMLLPKGKTALVSIANIVIDGKAQKTDTLTLQKNPNVTIGHNGDTDEGENPEIQLAAHKKRNTIKITANTTFTETQYLSILDPEGIEVGKIEMAPNALLALDVKIIPLVLRTASNVSKKAEDLYDKAIKNSTETLADHLNTKAFCQAGIQCTVLPFNEFIEIDPKDNVNHWDRFYKDGKFKDWDYINEGGLLKQNTTNEDGEKRYGANDQSKRFLLDKLEDTYYAQHGRTYKGALVFVTDQAFAGGQDGYSQNIPLRSQGTVIFSGILQDPDAYAHEIAHMLGLEHTFFIADKYTNEINDTNAKISELTGGLSIPDIKKQREGEIAHAEGYMKDDIDELEKLKAKKELSVDDKKRIKELEESIASGKTNIRNYENNLQKIDIKTTGIGLKVTKGKTQNYMDYISDRMYFQKHQVEMMRTEVTKFYQ